MNENNFLNKIKASVLKEDPNASLILFGSRARGDYREDSDWDVLVLTSKAVNAQIKRKIRDDIYDVELEFNEPVTTLIFDKQQWASMAITPLYQNVSEQGRIL